MANSKKKFFLIFGCFTLTIGIIILGILIRERNSIQEEENANSYCIDNMDTNIDKDSQYHDYVINVLVEAIKEKNGVKDCQIYTNYSNGEIVSVNVNVVAEDDEVNITETDILDYVSKTLGISTEDIIVSYD